MTLGTVLLVTKDDAENCPNVTKKFTGGCIAIPEEYMAQLLKEAEPGMRIIINKD